MPLRTYLEVPRPARIQRRHRLLDVAIIADPTDQHAFGGIQWVPAPCERPGIADDPCPDGEGEDEGKEFLRPEDIRQVDPFAVYGSFQCSPVGFPEEQRRGRALEHLLTDEARAVEYAVWTGASGNRPRLADPTTEVLGSTNSAAQAVAWLEDRMAVLTPSRITLHMPVGALSWLSTETVAVGDPAGEQLTPQGSPIAAGAGYSEANTSPTGVPAPAGAYWIYATGPVYGWRGPILELPDIPMVDLLRQRNEVIAMAERPWLIGWDCPVVAVLLDPGLVDDGDGEE